MKKNKIHAYIDAIAFVGIVLITATGLLMHYILPPGSGHFMELWGMDRHEWGQIHFWIAVGLLGILALHLILHWRWVISMIKGKPVEESGYRMAFSILAVIALLVLALSPFFTPVEQSNDSSPHKMRSGTVQGIVRDSLSEAATIEERRAEANGTPATKEEKQSPAEDKSIKGSMTLIELQQATGIPYQTLLAELGLPGNTSKDETIGRLGKQNGFDMDSVRNVIQRIKGR